MSEKSTYDIARETAIEVIKKYNFNYLSDQAISTLLEYLPESHFRNYRIVQKINSGNDLFQESSDKSIGSIEDFFNK